MSRHVEQTIGDLVVHLQHEQDDQWSFWAENRSGGPVSRISVAFAGDADLSVVPERHSLPSLAAHAASQYIGQTLRPRTERAAGEVMLQCDVAYQASNGRRQRSSAALRLVLPGLPPRPAPLPPRPEQRTEDETPDPARPTVVNIYHGDIVYGTKDSIEINRGDRQQAARDAEVCPRCRTPRNPPTATYCAACGQPLR